MKLASAALLIVMLVLTGCGGNASPTTPTLVGAPGPPANINPTPTTTGMTPFPAPVGPAPAPVSPIPTTPGFLPTTPIGTPTTPTTPTGGIVTVVPTEQPGPITGTWVATLTTTTGTPALAFTVALQQNADGSVTATSITFTIASPCFGTKTTATGQLTDTTLNLLLSSALASGEINTLQFFATLNTAATAMTGTFVVTPAAGVTACGKEAGTISMVRQ